MITNPIPAPPLQGRGHEFFEYIIPCYNYNASISSAVKPVYFAICSAGRPSAFMLLAAFTMSSLLASSNSSGREAHSSQSVSAR